MVNCEGLRGRKKAATRAALSAATVRLARELGLDVVTVEAIAEAAGVSTRTFHNYFSSKEEAIMAYGRRIGQKWADMLLSRPAGEPIWDSIEAVLLEVFDGGGEVIADSLVTAQLIETNPALLARKIDLHEWTQELLCRAIAERTGTNAETDLYPRLINFAAFGATRAAMDLWAGGHAGDRSLADLIRDGVAQLRAGLPDASQTSPPTGQDL